MEVEAKPLIGAGLYWTSLIVNSQIRFGLICVIFQSRDVDFSLAELRDSALMSRCFQSTQSKHDCRVSEVFGDLVDSVEFTEDLEQPRLDHRLPLLSSSSLTSPSSHF